MLTDFLAVGCGLFVGFSLGLIGGGGSILATPLLLYVVGMRNPHLVIGTGALAVAANAFINLGSHARAGTVRWPIAAIFAVAGILGAFVGSTLGKAVDGQKLLFLFAVLMVVVGVLMLRPRRGGDNTDLTLTPKRVARTLISGLIVGVLSGFFGIGGGFLIVPGLIFATGMPLINAIGSSLLSVGSFGLATSINYASSHLVDWIVAGEFILGGVLGGFFGMKLAIGLAGQRATLNRVFAGIIFTVAAYMIWRTAGPAFAHAATP
jgi:uncharacterized membrane protein YfcA